MPVFINTSVSADILEADAYESQHKFVYPVSICFEQKDVRPSVRLSICSFANRVDCDETDERSLQIFIEPPYERPARLVF